MKLDVMTFYTEFVQKSREPGQNIFFQRCEKKNITEELKEEMVHQHHLHGENNSSKGVPET